MEANHDQYASMREYTQMGHLHQLNENMDNSDESDIDIIPTNMDIGRGRRTANDCKQWMFVVKKTDPNVSDKLSQTLELDEHEPLLSGNTRNATQALNALHQSQTRNTLEMDVQRTDLHISQAVLPPTVPSPVPNVDFLYIGISEKRMKYWCDTLEYQLNLCPELIVEWLLMVDNQLAHATHNDAIENRQFNLKCWRDLYCRYYSHHVNQEIYKFYRKYGYGYDEHYAKDQFHIATDTNMYSRDISQGSIFREIDRIRLTKFSFQSNLSSTMNNGYMSTFPIDEIDKRIKDKDNVLIDAFPCHEYDVLSDIYQQIWSSIRCISPTTLFQIPLAGIRDYFGEQIAYYFLFLISYTRYMVPLASVGFFYQIYQITTGNVEVELIGFFAILVLIWGALVPLLWRQQESRYACKWGQYSNETVNPEHLDASTMEDMSKNNRQTHYIFEPVMERVEFVGKPCRSTIDGAVIKTDDELQRVRNYIASWGLLATVLIGVSGISFTFVLFMLFVQTYVARVDGSFTYGTYGFGILNALSMLVMEYVSLWLIPLINNFENHRTNLAYKKAFITKKILFDFINYYVSFLFIVFVVPLTNLGLRFVVCDRTNCLMELQTHFSSVFVTLIVFRLAVYLYNFTCGRYSYRVMKRVPSTAYFQPFYDIHDNLSQQQNDNNYYSPPSRKPELSANEYLLYRYEDDIQKPLNEFLIQFGYLMSFALFFAWAAPIALLYNLIVIRLELHKLTVYCRRPFPQGASSISPFNTWFKVMTGVSVAVSFYIFTVDSYELRIVNLDERTLPELLDWIALLVIFAIFYALLLWLFPAVPHSAKDHIKRQMFVDQSIASNYGDMKSFQESIAVSSLLRLRQWSVDEVHDYFNCYGHPRYTQFAKCVLSRRINGEKLLFVTKRDLQLFGISDQYHRMWIEQEIESLKVLYHQVNAMVSQQQQRNGGSQIMDTIQMDTVRSLMRNERNLVEEEEEEDDDDDESDIEEEEEEEKKEMQYDIDQSTDTGPFLEAFIAKEAANVSRFGDARIGILTTTIGGKSSGDVLLLRDVIQQFQTVIKESARRKLIKSFASKKIKVCEFKSLQQIEGLLQLIILLICKLKYKDNVKFVDDDHDQQQLKLQFIQWIRNDKQAMNGKVWPVDQFANSFDQWCARAIL